MFFKPLISSFLLTIALLAGCEDSGRETADSSMPSPAAQSNDSPGLQEAPDFTMQTMNGEPLTLSEHRGKVIVLNVWATWCPPCRKEIPDFIELQNEMRDDNVLFLGVSVDKNGWKAVRPFAKKYRINYPIMVDNGTVSIKYGPIRGIPTTFIINKEGKIEYVAPGMVNKSMLKPILEELAKR